MRQRLTWGKWVDFAVRFRIPVPELWQAGIWLNRFIASVCVTVLFGVEHTLSQLK